MWTYMNETKRNLEVLEVNIRINCSYWTNKKKFWIFFFFFVFKKWRRAINVLFPEIVDMISFKSQALQRLLKTWWSSNVCMDLTSITDLSGTF